MTEATRQGWDIKIDDTLPELFLMNRNKQINM
jgi:hypothetical protein